MPIYCHEKTCRRGEVRLRKDGSCPEPGCPRHRASMRGANFCGALLGGALRQHQKSIGLVVDEEEKRNRTPPRNKRPRAGPPSAEKLREERQESQERQEHLAKIKVKKTREGDRELRIVGRS